MNLELNLEPITKIKEAEGTRFHFFIVGAGGTGGHLIPNLARLISSINENLEDNRKHFITLVDADEVEQKNLIRQNFTKSDLGKNKAEVLANRYSRAFGVTINYIAEYIESPKMLKERIAQAYELAAPGFSMENSINQVSVHGTNEALVVIDCVDNNKTRLIIHEATQKLSQTYVISSGNGEMKGQVLFQKLSYINFFHEEDNRIFEMTNRHLANRAGISENQKFAFRTPGFFELFPDSSIDKLPNELSCAEFAESSPQNISANINAANIIFDFTNKLLTYRPIEEFLIFFHTEAMTRSVYRLRESDVKRALSIVPNNGYLRKFFSRGTELPEQDENNLIYAPLFDDAKEEDKAPEDVLEDIFM